MKKLYIFTACVLALAMIGLCGCRKTEEKEAPEQKTPQEQILNPDFSEQTPQEEQVLNPDSEGTPQQNVSPQQDVSSEALLAAPDYEFQLYESDAVILGEVVETLEEKIIYPNDSPGAVNNVITPYVVRIDKSYKGPLAEGDTVLVCAWNYAMPQNVSIEDYYEFYLHDGQRGVFQLEYSDYISTAFGQPMYEVVYQDEGFFEQKEKDGALVYASPSFEVTLDQIPEDIKKADEQYGK